MGCKIINTGLLSVVTQNVTIQGKQMAVGAWVGSPNNIVKRFHLPTSKETCMVGIFFF
jgi:hypothetical protein